MGCKVVKVRGLEVGREAKVGRLIFFGGEWETGRGDPDGLQLAKRRKWAGDNDGDLRLKLSRIDADEGGGGGGGGGD